MDLDDPFVKKSKRISKHDYTYEQAHVSWEMKHYRVSITEHYLRR